MGRPALAVCDVGNTAIKAAVFDDAGVVVAAWRAPAKGDLAGILTGIPPATPVVVVSVSDAGHARLEEALGRRVDLLGRDLPPPFAGAVSPGTGHDRLCAAAAARARAGGAAVALGLGTAVTADAVDGRGAFLGGAIAPGLRAAAAGLAAAAPRLPPVDLDGGAPPFPGGDTAAAMAAGHLLGFAGLVDRLAAEAAGAAAAGGDPARVPVFLHGGDADRIRPLLARPTIPAPDLVLEGARWAWLANGRP